MATHQNMSDDENDVDDDFEIDDETESVGSLQLDNEDDTASSEEEVLGIYSSDDEDEIDMDTELIDDSESDKIENELPNLKAWGKRKKNYYNSDYVTKDGTSFQNDDDEEVARLEEEEATAIQKRLAAEIDDADLSTDFYFIAERKGSDDSAAKEQELIEVDLSQMSDHDKMKLLKKQSPELLTYINDFKDYTVILKEQLHPLLSVNIPEIKNSSAWNFVKIFSDTIMTYCSNILFYILLKTRRTIVHQHPVMERLSYYRNTLSELELLYKDLQPQIDFLLSNQKVEIKINARKKKKKTLKPNVGKLVTTLGKMEKYKSDVTENILSNEESSGEGAINAENSKRKITYQIEKNKGLTPRRKKEMRNPRVKLRNRYRKAKIRRKGQVREVRKELKRYAGELSGINKHVSRSIKLKF